MPIIQVVNVELVQGADIRTLVQDFGNEILKQDGVQEFSFGTHLEQPTKLAMLFGK